MTENKRAQGIIVRPAEAGDAQYLEQWLNDEEISRDFPVAEASEIQEAARRWIDIHKEGAALAAVYQGVPVGFYLLFLQHYERIRHQAVHILVVAKPYRNLGIGSQLLEEGIVLAKGKEIELLHVEIYGNPEAEKFYKRRGFTEYARQQRWFKEGLSYQERVCLERFL